MKGLIQFFCATVLLTFSSTSYASITNSWWHDDGDGALVCSQTKWVGPSSELVMYGVQNSGPGNMWGEFTTDSSDDPRARKTYFIDNNTGLTWVGYNVDVYMDRAFSISNIVTSLPGFVPGDWTYTVDQPVLNYSPLYYGSSEYVGHIEFYPGTLVADGEELDFAYDVGFSGATTYRFEDTLTPVSVPEPGTLSLLGLSACLLGSLAHPRRQNRR